MSIAANDFCRYSNHILLRYVCTNSYQLNYSFYLDYKQFKLASIPALLYIDLIRSCLIRRSFGAHLTVLNSLLKLHNFLKAVWQKWLKVEHFFEKHLNAFKCILRSAFILFSHKNLYDSNKSANE